MSHREQTAFLRALADANPTLLKGARILEVGSYDVNGTARNIFGASAGEYVGLDLESGPGVDVVGFGHEFDAPDASFDLSFSAECFEHDPHWAETFENMVRVTRPGGLVSFTCASAGRPEHGTRRTTVTDSPGTQAVGLDYYRNLDEDAFGGMPLSEWFSSWRFWYLPVSFDLYFAGIRAGAPAAGSLPTDHDVAQIGRLMPLGHRLVRLPLRLPLRVLGDGERYQRLVLPYWQSLLRIQSVILRRLRSV